MRLTDENQDHAENNRPWSFLMRSETQKFRPFECDTQKFTSIRVSESSDQGSRLVTVRRGSELRTSKTELLQTSLGLALCRM